MAIPESIIRFKGEDADDDLNVSEGGTTGTIFQEDMFSVNLDIRHANVPTNILDAKPDSIDQAIEAAIAAGQLIAPWA